jgi:hypothetical protein
VAHFAEIDANNVVLRVIVIDDKDTSDANGVEKEHIGAAFCERLFGGTWKQTSYNGNFRKNYAGINYIYNAITDEFLPLVDTELNLTSTQIPSLTTAQISSLSEN